MTVMLGTSFFAMAVTAICLLAIPLGTRLGLMDHPDGVRKLHHAETPLIGGLAVMLPLLVVSVVMATGGHDARLFAGLAIGIGGFLILGMTDDRAHLKPWMRLLAATILCIGVVTIEPMMLLQRIDLGLSGFSVNLGWLAIPFTILCVVGLINALNMIDGKNGLLIGMGVVITLCMLIYAPPHLTFLLGLLLLGLMIVLPFNLKGRLFLGDSGSNALGAIIAMLLIYIFNHADSRLPQSTVALWLLVPVVDCLRLIVQRTLHGRSPMEADRNHFHHWLAHRWGWPQALPVYLLAAGGPGLVAAFRPDLTWAMIAVAIACYLSLAWMTRPERRPARDLPAGNTGARGA